MSKTHTDPHFPRLGRRHEKYAAHPGRGQLFNHVSSTWLERLGQLEKLRTWLQRQCPVGT